jgi:predicted nucleic acid-binding protein
MTGGRRNASLLSTLVGQAVDAEAAEESGAWLAGHHTIESADLAAAATAIRNGSRWLTRSVRWFPMSTDL